MSVPPDVKLTDLFDMTRFPGKINAYVKLLLIVYVPIGIVLLVSRLTLLSIWIILFLLLPINQRVKKLFCNGVYRISGFRYKIYNENYIDKENLPRFIVANHTYTFEAFPFIAHHWCILTGRKAVTEQLVLRKLTKLIDGVTVSDFVEKYAEISTNAAPIWIYPEAATTNGRVGLLQYNPLVFFYGETILPIAIKLSRPLPIAYSKLHLAVFTDLLWLLYVPWTLCEYTLLPPQKIQPGELPFEFARRIQVMTAETLGLVATNFTVDDKNKLRAEMSG